MPFTPNKGSQDTIVSLSGMSLASSTGVYLISGSTRGQCTLLTTGNSLITFNPPSISPGNLRSGNFQVFNSYGDATTSQYFTWIETPKISGINPSSGFTGSYFRISGSGARDYTGLWFNDLYTGVLTDAIFENSTWLRSGIVPFISGGLNAYFSIKGMSEGGSSISPRLFFVREEGLSFSGITNFPVPIQIYNYLRGNSTADGLEWQTPNQLLNSISGVFRSGDTMSGDLTMTGAALNTTGIKLLTTGTSTGHVILTNRIFSGNYIISEAKVGGVIYRAFSLGIS